MDMASLGLHRAGRKRETREASFDPYERSESPYDNKSTTPNRGADDAFRHWGFLNMLNLCSANFEGRLALPCDVSEERSALGVCFLGQAGNIAKLLRPDDFSLTSHKEIFAAICALVTRGERGLEISLVADELKRRGTLTMIGGEAYLADLDFGVVPEREVESRALLLRELADRRRILKLSEEAMHRAADLRQPISETRVWIRESIG
jgi:hypothetical protein